VKPQAEHSLSEALLKRNAPFVGRIKLKVTVESLGLPTLSGVIGKRSEVEFSGATVADLVDYLSRRHGPRVRQILVDGDGVLDLTIQVMVNDDGFVPREELTRRKLKEGDRVRFMLLVGGG
jgi:sulfur carrier protein ThiS